MQLNFFLLFYLKFLVNDLIFLLLMEINATRTVSLHHHFQRIEEKKNASDRSEAFII